MIFERPGNFRGQPGIILRLIPLVLLTITACGFSWGKRGDSCAEAKKLLPVSSSGFTDVLVKRILDLCPDGAAGHLAIGFQAEREGDEDQAIEEYRHAIDGDPSLRLARGNLGLLLLKRGADDAAAAELSRSVEGVTDPSYHRGLAILLSRPDSTAALLLYHAENALKGYPDDPEMHILLANAHAKQGQLDRAIKEYAMVLNREPANQHARLGLAEVQFKSGHLDQAILEMNRAALANPSNKAIHRRLAEFYLQKGDRSLADTEMLLAGLTPKDDGIDSLIQQGDQHLLARNYDKAIDIYKVILKRRPDWPVALEKLGDAQMAAGRDDEAIITYGRALSIDASHSSLHYTLGILNERKGQLNEAEAEYRKALRFDPHNGDAGRRLADIYTMAGKYPQAIAEYRELLKLRGDNPLLHFKLARAYEKSRDYPDAISEYQAAIKLAPDNLEARKELAALCIRRGIPGEAETQFKEVLKLKKDDLDARNTLTSLYVRQKKYTELLSLLKEGVEVFPRDPNSHYKLGTMYQFNKDYQSAITQYQETILLKKDHAKALNALVRLYVKTGDTEKAKGILETARAADPNFVEPHELLSTLQEDRTFRPKKHRISSHKTRKMKKGKKGKKGKSIAGKKHGR